MGAETECQALGGVADVLLLPDAAAQRCGDLSSTTNQAVTV